MDEWPRPVLRFRACILRMRGELFSIFNLDALRNVEALSRMKLETQDSCFQSKSCGVHNGRQPHLEIEKRALCAAFCDEFQLSSVWKTSGGNASIARIFDVGRPVVHHFPPLGKPLRGVVGGPNGIVLRMGKLQLDPI